LGMISIMRVKNVTHFTGCVMISGQMDLTFLDDTKPLPQANDSEMFFYRESVDVDYSMEIQQKSGVTLYVNSYGGEVETCAQLIVKASTIDTLKFLNDESFELSLLRLKEVRESSARLLDTRVA
jgi:hypothetical protein